MVEKPMSGADPAMMSGAGSSSTTASPSTGKLIIVPTPIGNLGDITVRALDALRTADVICAEDTRVTAKLLRALDIKRPHGDKIERLDENTLAARIPSLIGRLKQGQRIAYCTDAGTPGVSDPGLQLVAAIRNGDNDEGDATHAARDVADTARTAHAACTTHAAADTARTAHATRAALPIEVEVLPGACAAITAYVSSGTTAPHYYFAGFFPRKTSEAAALLARLADLDAAIIFYESPKRVARALSQIAEAYPQRRASVCRELTKVHEEVLRASTCQLAQEFQQRDRIMQDGGPAIKGEFVIVIDPANKTERAAKEQTAEAAAEARAADLVQAGETQKQIVRTLMEEFGLPKNKAYDIALRCKKR